ncbi:serine/threonine-protein kinase pim-2-like [Triplophysa dalaica]|uniref:serine/threonine-protein kinase pim-2-like n=1 Tax=Triplophysa dalaica TaxID=1582913 RepID=UPI0024DF47B9|nr:serine/threonine-protein kinase pim-2-like [Triplophysa dalaica]
MLQFNSVVSGLPADSPAGPPADSPAGPPADSPAGPPADSPAGPPADSPAGPPADSPAGPPADSPAGPPAESPAGPPGESPAGPPGESPAGPPAKSPAVSVVQVAVKYLNKDKNKDYISIPGYDEPIPREVALLTLASKGNAQEIIQLLDWQVFEKNYIMVLERFTPCEDLSRFLYKEGNKIDEGRARVIMWQAAKTAYMCCKRGVFHRDIKLENFLINTDTLQIKLIDFGCGDFLKTSAYTERIGTEEYFGPEFFETGKYYAKSTTVYSLGVLLFTLLCGRFPDSIDKDQMKNKIWSVHGFSKECCSLVEACMMENPKERIPLRDICGHKWFQSRHQTAQQQKITESPAENDVNRLSEGEILPPLASVSQSEDKKYKCIEEIHSCQNGIGKKLGQGGFGTV